MNIKIIIKAKDIKTAAGHRQHFTGTGVHRDKRLKRCHTRSNQRRKAIQEW